MSKTKVVLNHAGFRALLTSPEITAEVAATADRIAQTAGDGYETDALVASIIGGVTFEGGRGTVFGAFLGCLLTGIISNALDILGVHAYVKVVISGAIIVGAVVLSNLDNLRKKR